MNDLNEKAAQNLTAIREKKPLIHNITNFVVMNYTANALLAMGALPARWCSISARWRTPGFIP